MTVTLGCKLNQLESEAIADAFIRAGIKEETNEPSLIVINTCTVTSKADQKARREIRKALRDYPQARVIVTGCYAQLNKDDILKLETDGRQRLLVVGKDKIIDFINSLRTPHSSLHIPHSLLDTSHSKFQFNPKQFSQHTRSFLKIQDGCDKHCTYCKIRLARGKSVSLEKKEVLRRLRVLEENHGEAVLTGVNICQYQDEGSPDFRLAQLLDYLLKGTEKTAIRLSSLAPENINEKLCGILSHPRIRPHFHLSVQSCSGKILERMGRAYNAKTIENAVLLLRRAKDDPFLACDIISGFPGETETEAEQTFAVLKKLDFAWIHVFPFSKRQGTEAFSFKDNVKESEVTQRVKNLTNLANAGKIDFVRRWIGREADVLIEKKKAGICFGTCENYLKTLVRCEREMPSPGTVLRCRLTQEGDFKEFDAAAQLLH